MEQGVEARHGKAYRARGDTDRALADYDASILFDPNNAGAFFERGSLHYDRRDYDRRAAHRVPEQRPAHELAHGRKDTRKPGGRGR